MTQNQISYAKAKEEARHNVATENELSRHNVSVEAETGRHNVVTEEQAEKQLVINQGVLDETKRHNVTAENELNRHNIAVEDYNSKVLNETVRHNSASETELNRHNAAVETEATRSNKASEFTKQYQAETQRLDSTQATLLGIIAGKLDEGDKVYTPNNSHPAEKLSPSEREAAIAKLRTLRHPSKKSNGFAETFFGQVRTNIMNTTSFNALIN